MPAGGAELGNTHRFHRCSDALSMLALGVQIDEAAHLTMLSSSDSLPKHRRSKDARAAGLDSPGTSGGSMVSTLVRSWPREKRDASQDPDAL
jgi:hypothetical protein